MGRGSAILRVAQVIFIVTVTGIQVGNCRRTANVLGLISDGLLFARQDAQQKKQNWRWVCDIIPAEPRKPWFLLPRSRRNANGFLVG